MQQAGTGYAVLVATNRQKNPGNLHEDSRPDYSFTNIV
jgi:hypothetical protein